MWGRKEGGDVPAPLLKPVEPESAARPPSPEPGTSLGEGGKTV